MVCHDLILTFPSRWFVERYLFWENNSIAWPKFQNLPFNFLLGSLHIGLIIPAHSFFSPLYIFLTLRFIFFCLKITELSPFFWLYAWCPQYIQHFLSPSLSLLSHSLAHSLFKKSWWRCQECVCCPFDPGSDTIFRAMERAEPRRWHSCTLLLAWLLFLS